MIALSYSLTGHTCVWYYRHTLLRSPCNLVLRGLGPLAGAATLTHVFFKSALDLANPANSGGRSLPGLGSPSRSLSAVFSSDSI